METKSFEELGLMAQADESRDDRDTGQSERNTEPRCR